MASNNDFLVQLIAKLDGTQTGDDLKRIEQELNKRGINLKASIDTSKSKQDLKSLAVQLQKILKDNGLNIDTSKIMSAFNQVEKQADSLTQKLNKIQLSTDITKIENDYKRFGIVSQEVENNLKELKSAHDAVLKAEGTNRLSTEIDNYNKKLAETQSSWKELQATQVSVNQRTSQMTHMQEWMRKNQKATKLCGDEVEKLIQECKTCDEVRFNQIKNEFKELQVAAGKAGKLGNTLWGSLVEQGKGFIQWYGVSNIVTEFFTALKKGITTIKELDTELVDLKKTANMSVKEMEDFYISSTNVAKQMGVTTKEIIEQASAWSRLGFNTAETATQMAKLSSMFKLISPDMTSNEAVDGLVSVMKAYDIEVNDVLDGIMSKVNVIGNKFALSNSDIIAMLQDSVSAMAEGNNTLEETIALETAAFEIAQDRSVGNGFKTVALRLRGINEETEELDDSLKTIKGDLYDLTGVSVMQDADTFKSTYQILKDIYGVWDNLTDKTQAEALELMFGKQRANIGASVLKNFEAAEKAMDEMAKSAGNAEEEMKIAMDSVQYKLNQTGEIGTAIAKNLFNRNDMKATLDVINTLGSGVQWLTGELDLLGTVLTGIGGYLGAKNLG